MYWARPLPDKEAHCGPGHILTHPLNSPLVASRGDSNLRILREELADAEKWPYHAEACVVVLSATPGETQSVVVGRAPRGACAGRRHRGDRTTLRGKGADTDLVARRVAATSFASKPSGEGRPTRCGGPAWEKAPMNYFMGGGRPVPPP